LKASALPRAADYARYLESKDGGSRSSGAYYLDTGGRATSSPAASVGSRVRTPWPVSGSRRGDRRARTSSAMEEGPPSPQRAVASNGKGCGGGRGEVVDVTFSAPKSVSVEVGPGDEETRRGTRRPATARLPGRRLCTSRDGADGPPGASEGVVLEERAAICRRRSTAIRPAGVWWRGGCPTRSCTRPRRDDGGPSGMTVGLSPLPRRRCSPFREGRRCLLTVGARPAVDPTAASRSRAAPGRHGDTFEIAGTGHGHCWTRSLAVAREVAEGGGRVSSKWGEGTGAAASCGGQPQARKKPTTEGAGIGATSGPCLAREGGAPSKMTQSQVAQRGGDETSVRPLERSGRRAPDGAGPATSSRGEPPRWCWSSRWGELAAG